jgi:hypothetical protein
MALPCCVYAMIRSTFMPTSDEELADMAHSEFVAIPEDQKICSTLHLYYQPQWPFLGPPISVKELF